MTVLKVNWKYPPREILFLEKFLSFVECFGKAICQLETISEEFSFSWWTNLPNNKKYRYLQVSSSVTMYRMCHVQCIAMVAQWSCAMHHCHPATFQPWDVMNLLNISCFKLQASSSSTQWSTPKTKQTWDTNQTTRWLLCRNGENRWSHAKGNKLLILWNGIMCTRSINYGLASCNFVSTCTWLFRSFLHNYVDLTSFTVLVIQYNLIMILSIIIPYNIR